MSSQNSSRMGQMVIVDTIDINRSKIKCVNS